MKTYLITINKKEITIEASKIELAVRRGVESWLRSEWVGKKGQPSLALTAECVVTEAKYKRNKKEKAQESCAKIGHTMYGKTVCVVCKYTLPCSDCGEKASSMLSIAQRDSIPLCRNCIQKMYDKVGLPAPSMR